MPATARRLSRFALAAAVAEVAVATIAVAPATAQRTEDGSGSHTTSVSGATSSGTSAPSVTAGALALVTRASGGYPSSAGVNYVQNSGFDDGVRGWTHPDSTQVAVRLGGGGHGKIVAIRPVRGRGRAVLQTARAESAMAVNPGTTYTASVSVRSRANHPVAGWITLYTHTGNSLAQRASQRFVLDDQRWHRVSVELTALVSATNARVNLGASNLGRSALLIDDASLVRPAGAGATASVTSDSAAAGAQAGGQTTGQRVVLNSNFNNLPTGRMSPQSFASAFNGSVVGPSALGDTAVVDDTGGHGKVLRTNLRANTIVSQPAGRANGIVAIPGLGTTVNQACLSYDVRFDGNFDWSLGGKLPGLSGVAPGTSPSEPSGGHYAGDTGWSGRMMWVGPKAYSWAGPQNMAISYMYGPAQVSRYGDNVLWNARFQAGRWHTVKQCYTMNTVGRADGRLQAWLDGQATLDIRNFVYRTRPDVAINYLMWSVFRGGADLTWAGSHDDYIDFDNVAVTAP